MSQLFRVLGAFWAFLLGFGTEGLAQAALPPARAAPKPALHIGREGDIESEFVRINTALRIPSGEVAAVDFSGNHIRVFGSDGRFLRRLGRDGEGPGEFRRIARLFASGDTLIAYDAVLRRLTFYSANGTMLRIIPFRYPPEEGSLAIIGRQQNGSWIVATEAHSPSWNNGPGIYRDTSRVGILPASVTGSVRWLGAFPGMTFFVHAPPERRPEWRVGMLPFSPHPFIAAWRDSILVGDLAATRVSYYASDGRMARVLQLPHISPATNLIPAQTADLVPMRNANDSAYVRFSYAAAARARVRRIWERIVVGDDGTLWLAVADPLPDAPRRHVAVAPGGRILASWLLPARSRLLSANGSELLVAARDGDDIERITIIHLP